MKRLDKFNNLKNKVLQVLLSMMSLKKIIKIYFKRRLLNNYLAMRLNNKKIIFWKIKFKN
jgi:hypothetical protein